MENLDKEQRILAKAAAMLPKNKPNRKQKRAGEQIKILLHNMHNPDKY